MRRTVSCLLPLLVLAAFQLAGCPLAADGGSGLPISGPASGPGSGTGGSSASGGTGGGVGGSTAVGGDTSSVRTTPDALTVEFPGCEEPLEVAFWRSEVLRLVNQERAERGVATLKQNTALETQATEYACEMVYYRFFDHVNPVSGSSLADRATDFSYDYWIVGENLAAGQRSPAQVVAEWMASPCHRQNILNPAFTELGVGVRYGGEYGYYWVQEFGRPFSAEPYAGPPYHDPECPE